MSTNNDLTIYEWGEIANSKCDSATEPATVAVDAGALDELRERAEAYENAWESGMLHEKKIAALRLWHSARRLLAGGE